MCLCDVIWDFVTSYGFHLSLTALMIEMVDNEGIAIVRARYVQDIY